MKTTKFQTTNIVTHINIEPNIKRTITHVQENENPVKYEVEWYCKGEKYIDTFDEDKLKIWIPLQRQTIPYQG